MKLQQHSDYSKLAPDERVQAFLLCLGRENGFTFVDPVNYKSVSLGLERKETK